MTAGSESEARPLGPRKRHPALEAGGQRTLRIGELEAQPEGPARGVEDEVDVHLSNRIILNPYAAKRLAILLGGVVAAYEKRFGTLGVEVTKQ